MNKEDSDALVNSVDPYDHSITDPHHRYSVDHTNLLLAIYAALRRIEDKYERR